MSHSKSLRLGIVGLGGMGGHHARNILAGKIERLELTAVCDTDPARLAAYPHQQIFADSAAMIRSGALDALLICTPHYAHTSIGMDALANRLHVLVEKPISVHKQDCESLIAAHTDPALVFAAMFNQRADPFFQKIRSLVQSGELGRVRRINWIVTNWFRTHAYYASGGWRATWAGEGGGVLLNQCPHNLDLWQWIFGMPSRLRAFCHLGKYHPIEVEDDVTAYMEYPDGATGVFITTTGEAPGTNRLEVAGDRGRLVYENDEIRLLRNETPMDEFSRTSPSGFATPDVWDCRIPVPGGHGGQHIAILQNFTAAVLDRAPLLAPAREGIHSVELANAMLYSSATGATLDLPLDSQTYADHLRQLRENSVHVKEVAPPAPGTDDFAKSFR